MVKIPDCCRPRPKRKIPTEAHKRSLAWSHKTSGQGQDRTADLPLFREPSYPALTNHNAAGRTDLGTYRA
jgi:hypothetical protein